MIKYKIGNMAKSKGFSARRLADAAGVSPNTAALLIKAKNHKDYNVCTDVLDKVCTVFGCRLDDILEYRKR
ncbi:MAG: helix-turn-helix transcriptional regulator [bacterium]